MTLKEAMRQRTRKVQSKSQNSFYEVRIDFEVTAKRYVTEIIAAKNDKESLEKARRQFSLRPPGYVFLHSEYDYSEENLHGIQNIRQSVLKRNKKVWIAGAQKEILEILQEENYYLALSVNNSWHIYNTADERDCMSVNMASVNALFKKGLLIPRAVRDMTDKEIKTQEALGTLEERMIQFVINYNQAKQLKIKFLTNMPQ